MKKEDVVRQFTTPVGAPAFTRGPFRFYDREDFNILYRSDYDALRAVVPEPLEIDEPLVRWEIMRRDRDHGLQAPAHGPRGLTLARAKRCHDYLDNAR